MFIWIQVASPVSCAPLRFCAIDWGVVIICFILYTFLSKNIRELAYLFDQALSLCIFATPGLTVELRLPILQTFQHLSIFWLYFVILLFADLVVEWAFYNWQFSISCAKNTLILSVRVPRGKITRHPLQQYSVVLFDLGTSIYIYISRYLQTAVFASVEWWDVCTHLRS